MKNYRLSVVIEKDVEGYFAFCPELQGCYTQGDSYEEALENIKDAIRLHLEDRIEEGEAIPMVESISLTSLEVAV
ncbi:putative nuclease of the RNAse H fold, HicB family [Candidatus Methanophagaceae archaeon]|jgi:predicted RNase H-like HicB family nuclease|nr:putative nuclease of the RNAse H fold, HicB family [Methanophagales archaeon]